MKTKTKKPVQYHFQVTGGLDVSAGLEPLLDATGVVYGFKLPDGRECDLAICLRVEGDDGEEFLVSDRDLKSCGFENLDYDRSEFEAQ